jgi:hypothetical protein
VATNEKEIMDNNLIMDKISASNQNAEVTGSADALIDSIYETIKGFEKEAINAGREYSRHRMNQCIAVSLSKTSLLSELKTIIIFMMLAYACAYVFTVSKKFPKA